MNEDALIEKLSKVAKEDPELAQLLEKAKEYARLDHYASCYN
jgi:hypothetical protein